MSPKIFVMLCEEAVRKAKRKKEAKNLIFTMAAVVGINNITDSKAKKNK
jgi:hypothetical protein